MITFQRFQGGLYLTPAGLADPAAARVGFLFQDANRTDPAFELSQESWTDPASQGYFAFFTPSATRDWTGFAGAVRALFVGSAPAQFGWFSGDGSDAAATAVINVASQGTPQPWVQTSINLPFGSVALVLQATPFPPQAVISFDDPSNSFRIANPTAGALQLTTAPPNQPQQAFSSTSSFLALPMDEGAGGHAGSVNADFPLAAADLAAFEAGIMYFAPGGTGVLQALRYPVFYSAQGAATPMGFSAWLDVLAPLDDTRSYLQFTDPVLGSYFTAGNGGAFTLATHNGASASTSRLVFANRPVNQPTDTGSYYLTPAGAFGLGVGDGAAKASLLCGVTGTEFMQVGVAGEAADALMFVAGQPAFQKTTPGSASTPPAYLDDAQGNVTTSWVQLVTSGGSYVSQPQESPLYNQPGTDSALLHDAPPASGLSVYLLDFLPLPTWQAPTGASGLGTATAAPPVPMAPYSGLQFGTPDQAAPFLALESTALNPTRKNAFTATQAALTAGAARPLAAEPAVVQYAMTPQGLLAGLDAGQVWQTTQIAISPTLDGKGTDILQLTAMGDQVRQALQQNQVFLVCSSLENPAPPPTQLFEFAGSDQTINIAGWPFSLSPAGTPAADGTPPILILKFYPGQSIADLVNDVSLWSQPYVFNGSGFTPQQAQTYIQGVIQQACESVYGAGSCPAGVPSGQPDTTSLYYHFYQTVTDPAFSGLLALNCNMQLNDLPTAIRAVTGGMTRQDAEGNTVSNIDAFRVHHVGVAINDTDPASSTPTLAQSSIFGLVDYEKPAPAAPAGAAAASSAVDYSFEVEYLRALFTNSALSQFSCKINLTINSLFGTPVTLDAEKSTALSLRRGALAAAPAANEVVITGSYQAHSTSGDDSSSGQGVYSFVAEGNFAFTFGDNPYLQDITLTKLQFSFQQETPESTSGAAGSHTSTIQASFGIWGQMVFKQFDVLDIFSFQQLVFNDLGIAVQFDLTTWDAPSTNPPTTTVPSLTFSPGNLRLDLAASTPRQGSTSLLSLLPFKLSSFIYNEFPEQQTLEDLQYFSLSSVPLGADLSLTDQFDYGLVFDLDLGSWGALAGPLQAFRFSFVIGWLTAEGPVGKIAFGIQLPEANGKLEITIQGVLQLVIQEFVLKYQTPDDGGSPMLVLSLHNSFIQILGQRIPPGDLFFDFALFAPTEDAARIGWITALNSGGGQEEGGDGLFASEPGGRPGVAALPEGWPGGGPAVPFPVPELEVGGGAPATHLAPASREAVVLATAAAAGSPVFKLDYVGLGQRVGPDPASPPTNFADFLSFMESDFWEAVKSGEYDKVYHPDGQWLALTQFQLLGIVDVGFVFYDVTPFYSLTLNVQDWFNFEITYTKISDSIGLFYANFSLPDKLRTFQVGAASLTLPAIGVSVYTNGNWKLDVGFPNGNDWSRSFQVQAQAGPVPVTGAGGFYLASLSSATSPATFQRSYPCILAFGFAARLGVGKDFTCGPLKAGVSVTFFGIIQGAAGYLSSGATNIFQTPDALSLQGQFGVIGELYGSIDFVIIKASVNVRLQASIGIVLVYERTIADSGSILLYIEASVSVSVKVEIDLFLFSVTISFSFQASFRFQWQLLKPSAGSATLLAMQSLASRRLALMQDTVPVLPLCSGLTNDLGLWFLPEGTVVFPAPTGTGTPWLAVSLGIPYDDAPPASPTYSQLQPFEAATAQLVTWAVGQALKQSGDAYTVTINEVDSLDQTPDALVGWIDYPTLLRQLAVFDGTTLSTPGGTGTGYASIFPMPPFLQLTTRGRMNGSGKADDLSYVFAAQNPVDATYIDEVDAYFNQLFVNQESGGADQLTATLLTGGTVPLSQEIFLNYFTGLIRGGVHAVLQTMQNAGSTAGRIDQLLQQAVGTGQLRSLAGQMSSSFRGGARLPYTPGLTVPGGGALTTTNPLFALLWQEFPVGSLGSSNQYSVTLTNPDPTQAWLTSTATWNLTSAWLQPFAAAQATDVQAPTAPVQLPFTDVGPQSFAFQNPVVWTQPGNTTATLFPFPSNLSQLQAALPSDIDVLVQYRPTGAPYIAGGTPVPASEFSWATQLTLSAAQVPGPDGSPLPDVYSLTGASQQDQTLIEQILADPGVIAAVQVLYQTSAGTSGLTSGAVSTADVFVLRTNTTTVSAPPAGPNLMRAEAEPAPAAVPVGATLAEQSAFLQIVQQAAVTNAPGYYLRYVDTAGHSLPAELFQGGPAPLTLLVTFTSGGGGNTPASPAQVAPYHNTIVLTTVQAGMLYYAETTDPALSTQYATVAAGSMGMLLTQSESDALVRAHPRLTAMAEGLPMRSAYLRSELVQSLVRAGVTDEAELRGTLAEAGATASQLNALYSLVTYQVQTTTGFVQSNLSAPVQPQQPGADSAATDGVATSEGDGTSLFRVYAPLYKLAVSNQGVTTRPPNRYAEIGQPVSVEFYQNDAFGNQMPEELPFTSTNLYFDALVPVSEWQGVVTAYDFQAPGGPRAGTFTIYLEPSEAAFTGMNAVQAAASLQSYYTILDQLTGPGVTLAVESNLAVQADGTMTRVVLTAAQTASVIAMVQGVVAYLESYASGPAFDVAAVALTVAVAGPGAVPPVFELAVLLGVERDQSLISPLLISGGVVTFPAAQNRYSNIVPTVGASLPDGTGSVPLPDFAAAFTAAFPALVLSVGLGGAQQAQQRTSSAGRQRAALRAAGLASDDGGGDAPTPQSLWAVQRALVEIQVGQATASGPFYLSPTPLDNTLNSALVPLPPLPSALAPSGWPAQQLFTDVDLDRLNTVFFSAVDGFLAPASAAQAFEQANDAYTTVANGRRTLADLYSTHEIDWLFGSDAPFTGPAAQLTAAQTAFGEQMRAALGTAYAVDTVVQYGVQWASALPAGLGDLYSLFGEVRPAGGAVLPHGFTLTTSQVPVVQEGASVLTFLFGVANAQDTASVSLDLELNVTHVQHFLEPASAVPAGEARPSIWLQLVDPYPQGAPHVGPAGPVEIPVVFRQYPTPPTLISQQGLAGAGGSVGLPAGNPLTAAAAWHLVYRYQVQLTPHDQLASAVTYNTDLSASAGGGDDGLLRGADPAARYSLFEALARFSATFAVLSPVLTNLQDANWAAAAGVFAGLVQDVVDNTTWTPLPTLLGRGLPNVTDRYTITDLPEGNGRLITLTWTGQPSSFSGAMLAVEAVSPVTGEPYPDQITGTVPDGITDQYTPVPPLTDDWVIHQVEVDGLNVLAAENAVAGVQVERNLIEMQAGGATYAAQGEFVYRTPMVRATQPVTPFVDNPEPIDVASLPNQGIATSCPTVTTPPGIPGLCQRIYTLMYDLLADDATLASLAGAQKLAGAEDAGAPRRVKFACAFQYPVAAASGTASANPVSPLVPVVLARSFLIDGTQPDQLSDFSGVLATAAATWAAQNGVTLGPDAQAGAQFVFDITLYAEISGLNTPVLRLRTLQLSLRDIAV